MRQLALIAVLSSLLEECAFSHMSMLTVQTYNDVDAI